MLPEGDFQYLQQLAKRDYEDIRGERRLLVDPEEARILSIRKGNLDAAERHRDREPRHAHVQLPA